MSATGDPMIAMQDDAEIGRLVKAMLRETTCNPDGVNANERDVRAALRPVCERARAAEIAAERLLLLLKAAWREMPMPTRSRGRHDDPALGYVISLCIEEYYEPGRRG